MHDVFAVHWACAQWRSAILSRASLPAGDPGLGGGHPAARHRWPGPTSGRPPGPVLQARRPRRQAGRSASAACAPSSACILPAWSLCARRHSLELNFTALPAGCTAIIFKWWMISSFISANRWAPAPASCLPRARHAASPGCRRDRGCIDCLLVTPSPQHVSKIPILCGWVPCRRSPWGSSAPLRRP